MLTGPDHLFALHDVATLLRGELAAAAEHAARQPSGRALLLQACAANAALDFDARHLDLARLHVARERLGGDFVCLPDAIPCEDDAFRLVVVQHAGDCVPARGALIDELSRVLAPGGVLLWYGMNPWSPWLAWLHWQARHGLALPRLAPADGVRRRLLQRQLAPVSIDYVGSHWPRRDDAADRWRSGGPFAPLRGAYVLTASKQRAVLTPVRPRPARVAVRPQLVASSRRASA